MLLRARLEPTRRKLSPRARRSLGVLRWLFVAVFALEAFYVTVANFGLAFGAVQYAFASTDSVKADFTRAWSVWPGVVHVENLKITVQDHNIQCLIGLDRAVVTIRLRELPRHVFHATRLRGSGLSFHFRNRVRPEDARRPYVAALPPVPGFEDPPLFETRVPTPPVPDAQYDLWTVHVEDVDVEVRELWAQQFRYLGSARARGKFELMPARHLWVGPSATLDLAPGRLLVGRETPFLRQFQGRITCTVQWFDVRIPSGREVLRNISTHVALTAKVESAEVVRLFAEPEADVRVDQKGADIAVDVRVDHGKALSGSRLHIAGDALEVRRSAFDFDAKGPWSIDGAAEPGRPGGRVAVHVSHATLARDRMPPASRVRLEELRGVLASTTLDTSTDWAIAGGELAVGRAVAPELRFVGELLPSLPVRFTGGSGSARGRASFGGGTAEGEGGVQLDDAVARADGDEIRGSVGATVTRARYDSRNGAYSVDAELRARALALDDVKSRAACPYARVGAAALRARLAGVAAREPTGSVEGTIDDAVATWGDVTLSGGGEIHVDADGFPARVLRASARAAAIRLRGGSASNARWGVSAPRASIEAVVEGSERSLHGPVRVDAKDVAGTIGNVRMHGDVSAALRVAALDVSARTGVASGAVSVHAARLWTGERHVEDWWARVKLGPFLVAAKTSLDFDGPATVRLRDGLPALLALSEADELPGWLPGVLPLNRLEGAVEVHRHCRTTDVMAPALSGGPLTASGRISIGPQETRGAVLVRLTDATVISAGIALGGDDSGVSLFAGQGWLREQLDAVAHDSRAQASSSCAAPPAHACGE